MNCYDHDKLLWSRWIAVITMSCCGHNEMLWSRLLWSRWVAVVTMSCYDHNELLWSRWVTMIDPDELLWPRCVAMMTTMSCCDHDELLWSINSVQEASLANKDQSVRMDTMDKPTTSYRNWQIFMVCIARSIRRRISTEPTVPLRWKSPSTWSESGPIAEPQSRTNNRIKHERNNNSYIEKDHDSNSNAHDTVASVLFDDQTAARRTSDISDMQQKFDVRKVIRIG